MPIACFIDTNILLYTKDPREDEKRRQATSWLDALAARELAVVSPQVLNEFAYNVLMKFRYVSFDDLIQNLEALRPLCQAPMTDTTAINAAIVHRGYRFSFYDSALVATALAYGCDVFLSEGSRHGQRIEFMQIVDPFRTDLHAFFATD